MYIHICIVHRVSMKYNKIYTRSTHGIHKVYTTSCSHGPCVDLV